MPTTVVITDITQPADGTVNVIFSNGTSFGAPSLEALRAEVERTDNDLDLTQRLAIGWILARSPTLNNIAQIQNKDFTFDLSKPAPIKVQ